MQPMDGHFYTKDEETLWSRVFVLFSNSLPFLGFISSLLMLLSLMMLLLILLLVLLLLSLFWFDRDGRTSPRETFSPHLRHTRFKLAFHGCYTRTHTQWHRNTNSHTHPAVFQPVAAIPKVSFSLLFSYVLIHFTSGVHTPWAVRAFSRQTVQGK